MKIDIKIGLFFEQGPAAIGRALQAVGGGDQNHAGW